MRALTRRLLSLACFGLWVLTPSAHAGERRISGPFVHDNLAVYLVHGRSEAGAVPLSLQEALTRGAVRVHETGDVNRLEIENLGDGEVFVQSGDIVKGGRQDRVLMVSLVLAPKSGRLPVAAFCVEQGRWAPRGTENVKAFSSSTASLPSRELRLAMNAPVPKQAEGVAEEASARGEEQSNRLVRRLRHRDETRTRQAQVWSAVSETQRKLQRSIGDSVESKQSKSSLQLSLENEKLRSAQHAYMKAIEPAGAKDNDIVGYVFAINGKLNSGDLYASNALFRKMWSKQLRMFVTEAIAEKEDAQAAAGAPPSVEAVEAFLAAAEAGEASEREIIGSVRLVTRDASAGHLFETRRADAWVHRNYVAK